MITRLGRTSALLATVAVVVALSACEKYQANEAAAVVNGHEISLNELETLAEGNDDPAVRRAALTAWIQVVAVSEDPGELLTEADLAAARERLIPPLIEAAAAETQALYELGIDGSPFLCMSVLPLPLGVPSEDVLAELAAGTSFAELAAQHSEDPTLVESGGVLSVNGQECLPTAQWNQELIGQLVDGNFVVGEAGVVILNDSEVIVLLRPFAELSEASQTQIAQIPVSEALLEFYRAAEVTVHESIGEWDAEQGLVVAASDHE